MLRPVPIFRGSSEATLSTVASFSRWKQYDAGSTIAGMRTPELCVVVTGRVLISTYAPGGRQVTLDILGPGGSFGLIPLLATPPLQVDRSEATTLQPTLVAKLSKETFFSLINTDSQFRLALVEELAQLALNFSKRIVEFSTLTVRGRLLSFLLHMALTAGVHANQARLEPTPRHHELANYVGTNREQISREMSRLQREGLLHKDGSRGLVLTNIAGLQRLIDYSRFK